ncbi:DUF1801 domain-containing protein [Arenimonas terrae]|uniref:DUF1801 domain-containing protein n=1 Tax=Arenimonas terrae TaxID=2546226 RepID=A0A5C4RQA0_9GAMM|nr:DUF1801 domain-containing protein [Arenimonas terrae]TNJ33433.1 DUF1801 domain-containing protein [Arenimonas terrae]
MAEAKTQPTDEDPAGFLDRIEDPQRRADSHAVLAMMRQASGAPAVMWGPAIVGFGRYRLTYANGRTGDWPIIGFSPRKNDLTLYLSSDYEGHAGLMARLGKHKASKACLYLKRLADVDLTVLETLIRRSVETMAPRRVDR